MKVEQPTFRMIVGVSKLTPATQFDEERLCTFRLGSEVEVKISQDKNPKLMRRYWWILNHMVRDAPTPWKNSAEASAAIKIALGVVDRSIGTNGVVISYPRSLTDLDGPEFEEFYEGAMAVLYAVTGVDVETIIRESASPGDESPADIAPDAPAGEEGSSDGQAPLGPAAADLDPIDDEPLSLAALKQECIAKLLHLAADRDLTPQQRLENLDLIQPDWGDRLKSHPQFVQQCFATMAKVIRGELSIDAARKYLFSLKDA
jgi:hypothetical protein